MVNLVGWVSILKLLTDTNVCMGGCVRIFKLLTDAYMRGGVGGFGKIPCLRNMWTTPKLLPQFFSKEVLGFQIGSSFRVFASFSLFAEQVLVSNLAVAFGSILRVFL